MGLFLTSLWDWSWRKLTSILLDREKKAINGANLRTKKLQGQLWHWVRWSYDHLEVKQIQTTKEINSRYSMVQHSVWPTLSKFVQLQWCAYYWSWDSNWRWQTWWIGSQWRLGQESSYVEMWVIWLGRLLALNLLCSW